MGHIIVLTETLRGALRTNALLGPKSVPRFSLSPSLSLHFLFSRDELWQIEYDVSTLSSLFLALPSPRSTQVTILVEQGVFLQMEDIHRLENTGGDHTADPTFEIAFMLPLPGQQGYNAAGGSIVGPAKRSSSASITAGGSSGSIGSIADIGVTFMEVGCKREGCTGKVVTEVGPRADDEGCHYLCSRCALPAPVTKRESFVETVAEDKSGLLAMFDFDHVSSTEVLGLEDSLSMHATFGMEGKYFNPRVQRSEHFLEPWR